MNAAEYAEFRRKLKASFPSLFAWFESLPPDARIEIRSSWERKVIRFALPDALRVVEQLRDQADDPWPYDRDKERAGQIIAERIEAIRRTSRPREATQETVPRFVPSGAGSLFGAVLEAITLDDRHDAECVAHRTRFGRCRRGCLVPGLVAAELIAKDDDGRKWPEPRFRCPHCQDRGVVSVIQPSDIRKIAAGEPVTNPRTWAARCSCQTERDGDWLLRFDESVHVADTTPAAQLALKCKAYVECVLEDRRTTAFAEFNSR